MNIMTNERKGVHVAKGDITLDAIQQAIPHWIHDTRKDESSVTGEVFLPGCKCSSWTALIGSVRLQSYDAGINTKSARQCRNYCNDYFHDNAPR